MNQRALDNSLAYLDSWLAFRYSREDIPGFAVAVSHNGKLVFNSTYGYANLESKQKLTGEHLFRIASHSKTFTATVLMQLAEHGKLRIDDYVTDYLPWLKDHGDKRWQKVTIRQLMSHSAGVIRDGIAIDYWQMLAPFPDEKELERQLLASKLILDNNVKLKYSNFGYSLLGLLVEKVSKQNYADYVTENIIKPLGLKNTKPDYSPAIKNRLATGYGRADLNRIRLPLASASLKTNAMVAATGFCANASDLAKYFSAHFVGSGKLLDDESKKEMQRLQFQAENLGGGKRESYGLGLEIEYPGERQTFGHGGGFLGFTTISMADPKDKLVVVVLTNCNDGSSGQIAEAIFAVIDYFQKNTPARKPKHDLSRLAGRYFDPFSISDIVITGDKVTYSYPDSWWPLYNPTELERIDDTTFKIGESSSFGSEGELVKFNLKNGAVESVTFAGSTMWPEATWLKMQCKKLKNSPPR